MKDSAELEPLLAVTGGNPKAIEVALGLVKHERRPLKFVIDDLHAARGELFDDLFTRAWALLDEAARRVLMVMTFFPTSASGEALAATADVQGYAFDRAVERLTDLALLDIQKAELSNPPRYTLHPLVRMFAKLKLMGQKLLDTEGRERWMRWYVELAEQVGTCSQDLQKLKLLDNESETAFHVVIWSSKNQHHSICLQMCKGIAYYFYVRGDWETYLKIMRIRSFSASRLGDITEELRSLARQAQVFAKQGNIDAAKKIILNVQDKIESGKTNRYIETLFYDAKALLYLCEKNYHMAIYFWKMLANDGSISKESFIASQQALGNCLFLHGNSKSAMEILLDALFQADSYNFERNSISIKIKMAKIHIKEGLLSEAENLLLSSYEKAVEIQERRYIAQSKLLYARLYALRCERPMARVSLTEAIDLFERLGMRGELAEARQDLARLEAGEMSVAVPEESLADTDEPAQF